MQGIDPTSAFLKSAQRTVARNVVDFHPPLGFFEGLKPKPFFSEESMLRNNMDITIELIVGQYNIINIYNRCTSNINYQWDW